MVFSCKKQDFQPSTPVAAVMLTSQKQSLGFKLIPFVRELVVRLYAVQTLTQGSTVKDPAICTSSPSPYPGSKLHSYSTNQT